VLSLSFRDLQNDAVHHLMMHDSLWQHPLPGFFRKSMSTIFFETDESNRKASSLIKLHFSRCYCVLAAVVQVSVLVTTENNNTSCCLVHFDVPPCAVCEQQHTFLRALQQQQPTRRQQPHAPWQARRSRKHRRWVMLLIKKCIHAFDYAFLLFDCCCLIHGRN